jgi:hypothetical protein
MSEDRVKILSDLRPPVVVLEDESPIMGSKKGGKFGVGRRQVNNC